ncbi:MAG: Fe-S cluster assembly protein IscX [Phycisphaerae bacterium]|nr:Fe-S cluster assembly protein IscX [Phycisphaerae bacterium]
MPPTFGWLDVDRIAEELAEAFPARDPLTVSFPELRRLVAALPLFREEPGHPANEKILETIQMRWHEEFTDAPRDEED